MTAVDSGATPADRLTLKQKIGFGVGDFAINLFWQMTSLYLLYYYTDVLGLPPATAGWIFGAALFWDAILDPIAGYIADRTRTRWGSYRPYILFGCVPLALSFMAMFIPSQLKGVQLLVFVLITHGLFRSIYTVLSMPYNSLSATLTRDSAERGSLTAYRMVCATASGVFVAFLTLKLVQLFGQGDQPLGFLWVGIAYGLLSLPIFLFTFFATKESIAPPLHRITLGEAWRVVVFNRAFLLLTSCVIGLTGAVTFFGKTLPYVLKYSYERPDLIGIALSMGGLISFVGIPFWAWMMRRTSKKIVAMAGISICSFMCLLLGIIGMPSLKIFLVMLACFGIGSSSLGLAFWSMMPDTVEYGQWRVAVRGEGVIFGAATLAQKVALGAAVACVGYLLETAGYVANQVQTAQTHANLYAMMWQMPLAFFSLSLLCIFFYPISPALHRTLLDELQQRS